MQQNNKMSKQATVKYPIDTHSFLPYRFHILALKMAATGDKLASLIEATGMTIGDREWRVLGLLGAKGGLTHTQIHETNGLDNATITRAVQTLKKLGLVTSLASKIDRRKRLVVLTKAGSKFHDQVTPKRIATGKEIDSCFDPGEKEELLRLLDKLDKKKRGQIACFII